MDPRLIVTVTAPQEKNLEPRQERFVRGVVDRIEQAGIKLPSNLFQERILMRD